MARVFTANLVMASGSKWGELRLDINPGTQSIPNNTTAITYELYLQRTATNFGGYWSDNPSTAKLTINGTPITVSSFTYNFGTNYKKSIKTGSMTITHDDDGKKSITASASVSMSGNVPSGSGSGSLALTTIPRASSFTLSGSTQTGSAISVAISRKSSSFTHRVRWRVGSGSWTTVISNATTSSSFTVPHSAFPNSTSGTITVGVQTYNGTTAIGSEQTGTRALTVPTSIKPSLTGITHSEYVTLVKNAIGQYVQHNSRLSLAITGASAGSGASITAYRINVAGQAIDAISGTTNVITTSGSMNITGTVTDSRGRVSDTFSVPISVLPYAPPSLTGFSAFRSDSSGNVDFFNTWATVRFKTSVSSLNSKNTATYQIRSKLLPSGDWSTKTNTTTVGISTNVTKTYIDYARTSYYQFEIVISDKLSVVTIANDALMVPTAGVPFLVGHGGNASSFGKIATHGTTYDLEIGTKGLRVDGPVIDKNGGEVLATHTHSASQITSGTISDARLPAKAKPADYVVEQGYNYTKWNNGIVEQWGRSVVNTGITAASGGMFSSPDIVITFEIPFVGPAPHVTAGFLRADRYGFVTFRYITNTNMTVRTVTSTTFGSGYDYYINWHAVGRWK